MPTLVNTFTPRLQVKAFKTIGRTLVAGSIPVSQRFESLGTDPDSGMTGGVIDLTPYLGEAGGVRTSKSINEPAGGFTITLADKALSATQDSIYSALEPMDAIEIRMERKPTGTGAIPVVMRGFISRVRRLEVMGEDGRPQRSIVITGQDYGKIWQITQVVPLAEKILEAGRQLYIRPALVKFGLEGETTVEVGEFVRAIIETALNDVLSSVVPETLASKLPNKISTAGIAVNNQRVSIAGITYDQTKTIYDLIKRFCDIGVWNELYLEDRDGSVECILRPVPSIDLVTGKLIAYEDSGGGNDAKQATGAPASPVATKPPFDRAPFESELTNKKAEFQAIIRNWTQEQNRAQAKTDEAAKLDEQAAATADPAARAALELQADTLLGEAATIQNAAKALYEADYNALKQEIKDLQDTLDANPASGDAAASSTAATTEAPAQPQPERIGGVVDVLDVQPLEIVRLEVERSDDNVANFFWTESSRFDLTTVAQLKVFNIADEQDTVDFRFYGNSAADLYGDREMLTEVATHPGPSTKGTSGLPEAEVNKQRDSYRTYLREKRRILALQNKDNVVLESGTITLRGRHDVRPGVYLRINRAGSAYLVYVVSVEQAFVPFTSYMTTVRFIRGTSFAERLRATQGVYNAERKA